MTDLVQFHVEYPGGERDRWGTVFRPVLAIPHAILVGGPLIGFGARKWSTGVLGALALVCAFLDWFAILFTGRSIAGLRYLKRYYLSWRARFLAYACFLRDEYPPFGDAQYPAWLELPDDPEHRDVKSVGATALPAVSARRRDVLPSVRPGVRLRSSRGSASRSRAG